MSVDEPNRQYGNNPRPPKHSYPSSDGDRDSMGRGSQTTLPPMSSLLPSDEQIRPGQYRNHPSQSHHPHPGEASHPLFLSQLNPSASVQHIYYPPQAPSQQETPRYLPNSILLPNHLHEAIPPMRQNVPPPQERQSKKIAVRKDEGSRKGSVASRGQGSHVSHRDREDRESQEQRITPRGTHASQSTPTSHYPADTRQQEPSRQPLLLNEPTSKTAKFPSSESHEDQNPRPISSSGLLSPGISSSNQPGPQYTIKVRQQPLSARACGFGERDRRVIDPPPILQLSIEDPTATAEEIRTRLKLPYSVVHCTLWNPVTDKDDSAMPGSTEKRHQRRLMGTLVSSPFVGLDENGVEGCFFCFPDLSVRTPGTYSLKFSLVVIDPSKMARGHSVPVRTTIQSHAFQVKNAKDFGGMRASTELTKRLKQQGCLISVKKGNSKNKDGGPADDKDEAQADDDDDDVDDDEYNEDGLEGGGQSNKPAKRPKRY